MGAFADLDAYKTAIRNPALIVWLFKGSQGNAVGGRSRTKWLATGFATGATPSTAAALDRDTTGALQGLATQTGNLYPVESVCNGGLATATTGWVMVADRLSHQGGLSGTVITSQTTNLPTAALTRDTSGLGVMAGLEIYTAIGTTAQTATVSYTNHAGISGRTSQAVVIGGTNDLGASVFLPISLQDGDLGVRSVASVLLSGSTGTAGNFGVTLFKPLFLIPASFFSGNLVGRQRPLIGGIASMPSVHPSSCLMLITCLNNVIGGASDAGYIGYLKLGLA